MPIHAQTLPPDLIQQRRQVTLDEVTARYARLLGDGNISAGIRKALALWAASTGIAADIDAIWLDWYARRHPDCAEELVAYQSACSDFSPSTPSKG